jgi:RNA polymerase sigma factor (TIGR02999 family)
MDHHVTELLRRHGQGDPDALDEVLPLVYQELRRLARSQRRRFGAGPAALDTTALVHEAYLRFVGSEGSFEHRRHFFAVAATAMRQLLVDEAKRRGRVKRGGGARALTLDSRGLPPVHEQAELVLAVDEALTRLERVSPRLRSVVELRFFLGLSEEESAATLGVTDRTVRRDWIKARAWLQLALSGDSATAG